MTEHNTTPPPQEPASVAEMLGTEKVASDKGWAKVRMPIRKRHLQGAGNVQGGIIMALADHAISSAVSTLITPEQTTVTVELKVNFIAPARKGELIAEGHISHKGRTLAVGDTTITNSDGTLIASGLGTWMILQRRT